MSQRLELENRQSAPQKSFPARLMDEACRSRVHFLSARRRSGDDQSAIACIQVDVPELKKFHGMRKISSAPELKYFRFGLLSLVPADRGGDGKSTSTRHPHRER
jgi:hypothetical protein